MKLGVPLDSALSVKKTMEEAGYVEVVQAIYQWPMNMWPADKRMKELGKYSISSSHTGSNSPRALES